VLSCRPIIVSAEIYQISGNSKVLRTKIYSIKVAMKIDVHYGERAHYFDIWKITVDANSSCQCSFTTVHKRVTFKKLTIKEIR
jgi:hypothetical protein